MYRAISQLYLNPKARVILEGHATKYFDCPIGVKQGCCLSPTLFSIFINDLVLEIKNTNIGVNLLNDNNLQIPGLSPDLLINILLYADDIVLLAENEHDLQELLFVIEKWCKKWRLEVNLTKTNILHIRNKRSPQSKFTFFFNMRPVLYCHSYKYLGSHINEFLDYKFTVDKHSESASRALGSVIGKMIKAGGFPYKLFSMLYNACVTTVADYSGAITGFGNYDSALQLHLRAIRSYLGLPKNSTNAGVLSEVDLLLPKFRTYISMIRQYHRILNMNNNRLTKHIFFWDIFMNETYDLNTWSSEVYDIFKMCNLSTIFETKQIFYLKDVTSQIKMCLYQKQIEYLKTECQSKPKLRTFLLFKDFNITPSYITQTLNFTQRRQIAKLRLGCLPLQIELGRYLIPKQPENQRFCKICSNSNLNENNLNENSLIESEYHFLFVCRAYNFERQNLLSKLILPTNFINLPNNVKLSIVLNDPQNVKLTSQYIINLLNIRNRLLVEF